MIATHAATHGSWIDKLQIATRTEDRKGRGWALANDVFRP